MGRHSFIFRPGSWSGEGKVTLSSSTEPLSFRTRWQIPPEDERGIVFCTQEIRIAGLSDVMNNRFAVFDIGSTGFSIKLENQSIGEVVGAGLIRKKLLGWEFRLHEMGFEGFEFYEAEGEGSGYRLHAEYVASDDFRTTIHGKIRSVT
ncbi:MAG: hypothetical protein OXF02_02620 [Simkaniaceae bacterium]|nr:hypothetical protein [Simkaniaceae bacterium]